MKSKIYLFALLFLCCSCVGSARYLTKEIRDYSGDGSIKETSLYYMLKPVKGYEIRFDEFRLDSPYEQIYHMNNLPLPGTTTIYLVVTNKFNGPIPNNIKGTLQNSVFKFELFDSTGALVKSQEKRLGDLWWASGADPDVSALHDSMNSMFEAKQNEKYSLRVKYTPSGNIPKMGHVSIRCGGFI